MNEIVLRNGDKWDIVPCREIQYIEALNKLCKVFTIQRQYILSTPLQKLEDHLPKENFIKIHRCFLVSSLHISSMRKNSVMVAGRELPVSRSAWNNLQHRYKVKFN